MDMNSSSPIPTRPSVIHDLLTCLRPVGVRLRPIGQKIAEFIVLVFEKIAQFFRGLAKNLSSDEVTKKDIEFLNRQINNPPSLIKSTNSITIEVKPQETSQLIINQDSRLAKETGRICELVAGKICDKYFPEKQEVEKKIEESQPLFTMIWKAVAEKYPNVKDLHENRTSKLRSLITQHLPAIGRLFAGRVEKILGLMDVSGLFSEMMKAVNKHASALGDVESSPWKPTNHQEKELLKVHQIHEKLSKNQSTTINNEHLIEVEKLNQQYMSAFNDKRMKVFLDKTDREHFVNSSKEKDIKRIREQSLENQLNELVEGILTLLLPTSNETNKPVENEDEENKDITTIQYVLKEVFREIKELAGGFISEESLSKMVGSSKGVDNIARGILGEMLKVVVRQQIQELSREESLRKLFAVAMPQIEEIMLFVMVKHEFYSEKNLEIFASLAQSEDEVANTDELWNSISGKVSESFLHEKYGLQDFAALQENQSLRRTFDQEVRMLVNKAKEEKVNDAKGMDSLLKEHYKTEKAKENKTILGDLIENVVFKLGHFGSFTGYAFGFFKKTVSQQISDVLQDFEKPEYFVNKIHAKLKDIKEETVDSWIPSDQKIEEKKEEVQAPELSFKKIANLSYAILQQKLPSVSSYSGIQWLAQKTVGCVIPSAESLENLIDVVFKKLFGKNEELFGKDQAPDLSRDLWYQMGLIFVHHLSDAKVKLDILSEPIVTGDTPLPVNSSPIIDENDGKEENEKK